MDDAEREALEAKERMDIVKKLAYSSLVFSLVFTILSILALPGSWAETNDGLKEFTLREYCTRPSISAGWSCTAYNTFNGSTATASGPAFAESTPEAASIAFGMAVVQVVFNFIGLALVTAYIASLDASDEKPLGSVLLIKFAVLACTLAFIFGLIAMLSVAGDKTFQDLVWNSASTKDLWHWGVGYSLNIAAWVGTLVLDCVLFVLWGYAGEDDDEEDDEVEPSSAKVTVSTAAEA